MSPRATTVPMVMTPAQAHASLVALVEEHGTDHGPLTFLGGDPMGECWTNAWRAAQATGRAYVEGYAMVRGRAVPHAYTVDASGVVHETTEGFARAGFYRGIVIPSGPGSTAEAIVRDVYEACDEVDGHWHSSMIEGLLMSGLSYVQVLTHLRAR